MDEQGFARFEFKMCFIRISYNTQPPENEGLKAKLNGNGLWDGGGGGDGLGG